MAPVDVAVVPTRQNWAALSIIVLVAAVLGALAPFVTGLLGALALYVLVEGVNRRLARHLRPAAAAGITVTGALLVIVAPITWLITVLAERAPGAVSLVTTSPVMARLAQVDVRGHPLGSDAAKIGGAIVTALPSQLVRFAGSVTAATLNLTVMLFGLLYMLRAEPGAWAAVRQYVPFSGRAADALRDRFIGATRATILGTVVVCIVQGILIGVAFELAGLSDPLFWGTVAVFTAVVPGLGSTLVWLPAMLSLVAANRYGAAITVFVFGFGLAGNCDRVIRPVVYRHVSQIHPMITLVGALAGIRYYGILGLLLGPLAIVYVFELLRFYREEYTTPG
ncbi:MAG TPA: AI-2E family transporter [Gemmatimonadaceae bacterium]|jgi:predicted PurR-regulated permease PerM|nr:AI-2E family transporter [Gemmatimonadaceae bacterium]